mmetsp:Transcript_29283/g.53982  ORF Transcript_29283/g.53982 Transcript_29283/m.53982 type:complete len:242 (+) Transcript_29283:1311-2036(+)
MMPRQTWPQASDVGALSFPNIVEGVPSQAPCPAISVSFTFVKTWSFVASGATVGLVQTPSKYSRIESDGPSSSGTFLIAMLTTASDAGAPAVHFSKSKCSDSSVASASVWIAICLQEQVAPSSASVMRSQAILKESLSAVQVSYASLGSLPHKPVTLSLLGDVALLKSFLPMRHSPLSCIISGAYEELVNAAGHSVAATACSRTATIVTACNAALMAKRARVQTDTTRQGQRNACGGSPKK